MANSPSALAGAVAFITPIDPTQPGGAPTNERETISCIAAIRPVYVVCFRQLYPNRTAKKNQLRAHFQITYLHIRGTRLIQVSLFGIVCCLLLLILRSSGRCSVFVVRHALVAMLLGSFARFLKGTLIYRVLSVPRAFDELKLRSKRAPFFFRFFDDIALRTADVVVGATEEACKQLKWRRNVFKIPFSVAPAFYSGNKAVDFKKRARGKPLTVGYFGRFNNLYDFSQFLGALRSPCIKDNVRVRLVGGGWRKPLIVREVRSLQLQDFVSVEEFVPPDMVPSLLKDLDVLINPQVAEHHGLSIKVLEAMASGLTVVTTVQRPEFGKPDKSYIFVRNEQNEFARVISNLISNPALRKEISRNAREQARRFEREAVSECWNALLSSLVDSCPHESGSESTRSQLK